MSKAGEGALDGAPLAVFRRRAPGEIRNIALDDGDPPLLVAFEVPDGAVMAEAEAAVSMSMAHLRENPKALRRYGLPERALSDAQLAATARIATAVETAVLTWRDWTYSREGVDEPGVKAPLTPEVIAGLLLDQHIRAAWTLHLDAASPLERAEGNVSGVSPNTNTDGAPNIAGDASRPEAPAPAGDPPRPDDTVPG